eukprot:CAMPEP_0197663834 /NCGR_PEP_ID=MMETSP1338-20131121/58266_1 /TAXON_ID=43686 ORGANISM="Pelagodinium beii, Strain RCC1491" /NCGR_SAMPLE_ID=MMETSP1338 /ASSEMBLY_ACC=CAM_ASM_000754 /LENGTH=679 /DNA_ID=CAMNT_0043242343 /DNA_START=70 /DNA_END=2109 /DNA_ORIENTATION=+
MAYTKFAALLLGAQISFGMKALVQDDVRPTTKVVNLLKDMQETLEKEKEEDENAYEELKCWCKENDKGKTDSVKASEAKITELQNEAAELNATAKTLATEMEALTLEVRKATSTLDKARVLYGNKMDELQADRNTLNQDIEAVESAEVVVGGGASAFLQTPEKLKELAAAVQKATNRRASLLENTLSFRDRERLDTFFQDPVHFASLIQQKDPGLMGSELGGMFKAMEKDFETDKQSVEDEMKKEEMTYEELMASKKEEIKAGEASIEAKRVSRVEKRQRFMEVTFATEKEQKSIKAAQEFLVLVEERCSASDKDWQERSVTRQQEIESVSEAINILDSEDSHAMFSSTYSFIQEAASDSRLKHASELLATAGRSANDARLISLAAASGIKGMEKVKAAIDNMTADLKEEYQDDLKQKDFCVAAFRDNDAKVAGATDGKSKHSSKVDVLALELDEIATEISELTTKINHENKELATAKADYEKKKQEDLKTLADQKASQKILKKAEAKLQSFYMERPSLAQLPATPESQVKKGLKEFKVSSQGTAVIQLIATVIQETATMEGETTRMLKSDEKDMADVTEKSNKEIDALSEELDAQKAAKARAKSDMAGAKEDLKDSKKELADLAAEKADLHESCDFMLKNFDMRKEAREEEMEGLRKAKGILSGEHAPKARFSFLQRQ